MGKSLRAVDTITGSAGRAYANIDGSMEELLYAINVEAKLDKEKKEIPIMGRRSKGNKSTGIKLTGKMTLYYITTLFRNMAYKYLKTGEDLYFDMLVENEDAASAAGKQTIMLKGVNINSLIIAKLDANATELNEDVDFTYEDFEILSEFNKVEGEDLGGR